MAQAGPARILLEVRRPRLLAAHGGELSVVRGVVEQDVGAEEWSGPIIRFCSHTQG
jgi:hypothetical protein